MLSAVLLALAAFAAGVTGAWSPCGFSMVETLAGAAGREGTAGRRLARAGAATFAAGALAGGAATFTLLAALGAALGAGGDGALAVAAGIALAAALADALGLRIAPQIRRQVPEPWRRTLPLPLASGLYGILLGLGFTTFVLAFAVWALAGIAVAVGEPATGLAIGLAFGAGRALPVLALAPRHAAHGERLATRMAEEPRLLRRLRLLDGALLAACAAALALAGPASADAREPLASASHVVGRHGPRPSAAALPDGARLVARGATDPSVGDDGAVAWSEGNGRATLLAGGARTPLAGWPAAVGGPHLAVLAGGVATVTDRRTGATVAAVDVGVRASALAVSARWLAWRAPRPVGGGGELIRAVPLAAPAPAPAASAAPAPEPRLVAAVLPRAVLGAPALDGDRVAYAVATTGGSRIVVRDLASAARVVAVVRSRRTQLRAPALRGRALLYVQDGACAQRLRLRVAGRATRTLLRLGGTAWRDPGHEHDHDTQGREPTLCPADAPPRAARMLWSTALAPDAAYASLWDPRARRATLVRVAR